MRRPIFVPSGIALLSAALSFGLLVGTAMVIGQVAPRLVELLETSPRLAMLGFFGLVVAPGVVVTIVHHAAHRTLDTVEEAGRRTTAVLPRLESWWAGVNAWLIIGGASVLARLVLLVVTPPKLDPGSFVATLTSEANDVGALANVMSLYPVIWIVIAAQLFELERRTRRRPKGE